MNEKEKLGAPSARSAEERLRWLEAAHLLLANEYAFIGPAGGAIFYACAGWKDGTPMLALNMNDVFSWGCADAESFEYIDAPALVELVKQDGYAGLVKWARDRRAQKDEGWDEQHLRKYTPALALIEQRDALADALRRVRYIAGHKSTTPGSDYERIYNEATAALPADDLLRYPDKAASVASAPKAPLKLCETCQLRPASCCVGKGGHIGSVSICRQCWDLDWGDLSDDGRDDP